MSRQNERPGDQAQTDSNVPIANRFDRHRTPTCMIKGYPGYSGKEHQYHEGGHPVDSSFQSNYGRCLRPLTKELEHLDLPQMHRTVTVVDTMLNEPPEVPEGDHGHLIFMAMRNTSWTPAQH
jgi:hypothetical protein